VPSLLYDRGSIFSKLRSVTSLPYSSMALSMKGTSLKGTFDKFNGSNDVSMWKYNIKTLFRGLGVDLYIENQVSKPAYWSAADLAI
jgi:hypothetical protein